jgi:hypothetical protein
MHRKLPPRVEPRATTVRPLASSGAAPVPGYVAAFAAARARAIRALCIIAPLGALAGTVSACGGARSVRSTAYDHYDPLRSRASYNDLEPPEEDPTNVPVGTVAAPGTEPSGSMPPGGPDPAAPATSPPGSSAPAAALVAAEAQVPVPTTDTKVRRKR